MPDMFWVCQECVQRALIWLKENNLLYADIVILENNLKALLVDDVPVELIAVAQMSNEVEVVESEHSSYIPTEDEIG